MEVSDVELSSSSAMHGVVVGELSPIKADVSHVLSLLPASALSLFCSFSAPSNTILFSSSSQPLLSVHCRSRPKMSTESVIESTCLINIVSNLRRFIHRGMVDHTSRIWSDCNLHCFILRGMVDHTSLIWSGRNLCCFIVHAWLTVPA